jgi:hypothetical protein
MNWATRWAIFSQAHLVTLSSILRCPYALMQLTFITMKKGLI